MKTALILALVAAVASPAYAKKKIQTTPEFELAFLTCQRITGATGKYVIAGMGTNGVPVLAAGPNGNLRGEVLMNECIAQNLGTTTAVLPPPKTRTPRGKLPLPVQYPLLPGDAELWQSLTLEQQQRAMLFLKDGSSIRSSLTFE